MQPILLATDGSPSAEAATQEAIDLARVFDAPLLVVSVANVVLPDLHAAETDRVERLVAEVKDRVEASGLTCQTVALDGPAAPEICRLAADTCPKLLVIGAHGWGRVGRLLHGSVSTDVLHEASCPVLVVHGDNPPSAGQRVGAGLATAPQTLED